MNDSTPQPLVYVILGSTGSGRRDVLLDLIQDGIDSDESSLVLLADTEPADARDATLGRVARWRWDGVLIAADEGVTAGATHVFFVADGRGNPVDQIEALKPWIEGNGCELARVITVVNCKLAETHAELLAWYDACIHFSDVVLLANREGVGNKWLSDFQARFRDQYYPCLFEFVKAGKVKNPPLLLEPQARRMSHYFDEADWTVVEEEDDDFEIGVEDEEPGSEAEEEVEVVQEIDPYFERRNGGRRVKELPDIAKFLA